MLLGFLETGSAWVPYAMQQIRRRVEPPTVIFSQGQRWPVDNAIDRWYYRDPGEFFRSGRAFVNCEGDEDFDYLLEHVGEDGLMCSSDFPHGDPSGEENYVIRWRERSDMPERVKEKILGKNAQRFFRL